MTTPHEPAETPTPRALAEIEAMKKLGYIGGECSGDAFKELERENEELRNALADITKEAEAFACVIKAYSGSEALQQAQAILARANRQGGAQGPTTAEAVEHFTT